MPEVQRFAAADVPGDLLAEVRDLLDAAFLGDYTDDDWHHAQGRWHTRGHGARSGGRLRRRRRPHPRGRRSIRCRPATSRRSRRRPTATGRARVARDGGGGGSRAGRVRDGRALHWRRRLLRPAGWERWLGPTFVGRGAELVQTEEEDGGILVLRFGPSATVDLAADRARSTRRRRLVGQLAQLAVGGRQHHVRLPGLLGPAALARGCAAPGGASRRRSSGRGRASPARRR